MEHPETLQADFHGGPQVSQATGAMRRVARSGAWKTGLEGPGEGGVDGRYGRGIGGWTAGGAHRRGGQELAFEGPELMLPRHEPTENEGFGLGEGLLFRHEGEGMRPAGGAGEEARQF